MTRVAIDIHTVGGRQTGNETYARELVTALGQIADPDVAFVLYHTTRDVGPFAAGPVRRVWPSLPVLRVPLGLPIALGRDRIDLAHFQYVAPPLSACRTVVTVHDVSFEAHPEWFPPTFVARMRWLVPLSIRRSAHVLTLSEFTKRAICERYAVPPERVTVTPAAPGTEFRTLERRLLDMVRTELGLPSRFILAVGNLQPRKNLRRLLEAYARLPEGRRASHKLVLVGQAHYRSDLILAEIDRLGIRRDVQWTGYISSKSLVAVYNLADLFVFPSLYEGFGLPVVEAMACGLPVLSANTSCLPEVCGGAALMFDPLDTDALAATIDAALEDDDLRGSLIERGRGRAATLSWMTTARQTLAVYKSCC